VLQGLALSLREAPRSGWRVAASDKLLAVPLLERKHHSGAQGLFCQGGEAAGTQ